MIRLAHSTSLVIAVVLLFACSPDEDSGGTADTGADFGNLVDLTPDVPSDGNNSDNDQGVADAGIVDVGNDFTTPDIVVVVDCLVDEDCNALLGVAPSCQTPVCDSGECKFQPILGQLGCDDGNICTESDACKDGICVGVAVVCEDENPCTDEVCIAETGCISQPNSAACNDSNPCTQLDVCTSGTCVGYQNKCQCATDTSCAVFDDGNPCTGTLTCDGSYCQLDPSTIPDCSVFESQCITAWCDSETGDCTSAPEADGIGCDDGNPCTTGDACLGGACIPDPETGCNDGEPCTIDTCHSDGSCTHEAANDGACDDNNPCTVSDKCVKGICTAGETWFCEDKNPCTLDYCLEGGGCGSTPQAGPCDDGNPCTVNDFCNGGKCTPGDKAPCTDGSVCTLDGCDPLVGCIFTPTNEGLACDDGNGCSLNDTCVSGSCAPGMMVSCDDGNPCTTYTCTAAGACVYSNVPDGQTCEDGDNCTGGDNCQTGQCISGTEVLCDPCADKAEWAACDDETLGTFGDVCVQGKCFGFSRVAWSPDTASQASGFTAIGIKDGVAVATGWHTVGTTPLTIATWAAQLKGDKAPILYGTSLRTDTIYRDLDRGVAVGDGGAVSTYDGPLWDTKPGLATALTQVPGLKSLNRLWGTTLSSVPGKLRDAWVLVGENTGGDPWMATCYRESNAGGGFVWYCNGPSELLVGPKVFRAVVGQAGPCTSAGCTGLEITETLVAADGIGSGANLLLQYKHPNWTVAADVVNQPLDQWRDFAVGSSVWAAGTKGLLARRDQTLWEPVKLVGGAALNDTDFEAIFATETRLYIGARRIYEVAGKEAVDFLLITKDISPGQDTPATWIKLSTHFCATTPCASIGDGKEQNEIKDLMVTSSGIYIVGREFLDGKQKAVVYYRPSM